MQWYFIVLIVLLILVVIAVLPIFFSANIYFNAKENLGVVLITLWGITSSCFQLQLQKTAITIIKRKGKEKEVPIKLIDEKMIFGELFLKSIFRFIIINQISVFFTVGKENDAFFPSIIGGTVLDFLYCVFGALYTKKGEILTYIDVETLTDVNQLKLTAKTNLLITPIVILAGYLRAKRLTKRMVKLYERLSRQEFSHKSNCSTSC